VIRRLAALAALLVPLQGWTADCNDLPPKFALIKENLAVLTRTMTPEQMEAAITSGPVSAGHGFAYNFAFLPEYLHNDANAWLAQARACDTVDLPALAELDRVCDKGSSDFLTRWSAEKTRKATTELDRNRKEALGKALMSRRFVECFVRFEDQLLRR
jgi:hypothetical protein